MIAATPLSVAAEGAVGGEYTLKHSIFIGIRSMINDARNNN